MASDSNLSLSRLWPRILLLLAICLWQSGCFGIVRRQSSHGDDAKPWWTDPGNLGEGRDVQGDSASSPSPDSSASSEAGSIDGGESGTVSSSLAPSWRARWRLC